MADRKKTKAEERQSRLDASTRAAAKLPQREDRSLDEEVRINLRMSRRLRQDIEAAAKARDMTMSSWIRITFREAADRDLGR